VPNDGAERHGRASTARRPRRIAAIVIGVVALDQATKTWAVSALADRPVRIVGDDVTLRLGRNSGGAFNLFQGSTPVLALVAVLVAGVLVHLLRRAEGPRLAVALALLVGGACGNLVDRLVRAPGFLRGEVVDFIDVGPWPTFNLADSAITVGAVLLVIDVVMSGCSARRARAGS
jgi:signal peptidase II